jgi:sugar lactone lactonase YvrE
VNTTTTRRLRSWTRGLAVFATVSLVGALTAATAGATAGATRRAAPYLSMFATNSKVASTVPELGGSQPGNGDVNPYGVAVVPVSVGSLVAGDILVSNFNDAANAQGTGETIMQISRNGKASVFADLAGQVEGPIGLTTALAVFRNGDVIVGSLPTRNGDASTATAGALYVMNSSGTVIETIRGGHINGPWDMTAYDGGSFGVLFVTNVLNGTVAAKGKTVARGTVVRIVLDFTVSPPQVDQEFVLGQGFDEATNAAALVLGPTGLALAPNGTLYVADTMANRIAAFQDALFAVKSAGTGTTLSTGKFLNAPLGLALAPNGDVLSVNGANGRIVETTPSGVQDDWIYLDQTGSPRGNGALFGLAVAPHGKGVYFVDDDLNQLRLLH